MNEGFFVFVTIINIMLIIEEMTKLIIGIFQKNRNVQTLNSDGVVEYNTYLVLVDASKNHVKIMLPSAHRRQLSIVCLDASNGIEIVPNVCTENTIFDLSNADFTVKGDALTLVSDNATWYVVGRYASQWYA